MTPRTYASPEAFKQALEQRLRSSAKTGAEFARKRQLLVFDRFLARIALVLGDAATLKGGLVLELRLERARTTKDVDLRMVGSPEDVGGGADHCSLVGARRLARVGRAGAAAEKLLLRQAVRRLALPAREAAVVVTFALSLSTR